MTNIVFDSKKHSYDKSTKTFMVSETDVKFDTSYTVTNPKTGNSMIFELSHATGPEFDKDTKWVYKSYVGGTSHDQITLEVCNDETLTQKLSEIYLYGKLRN